MSPVQVLLLVRLEASPGYGYELLKAIKDAFEGVWEPKTGTIYPALRSLERQGLVATKEKEGVDFYHITEKGRRFLTKIGKHQEANMAFTTRFFATIIRWMSPNLRRKLVSTFVEVSGENANIANGAAFLGLLDEGWDRETKLTLLRTIRGNMSKRLEAVTAMIENLEAQRL